MHGAVRGDARSPDGCCASTSSRRRRVGRILASHRVDMIEKARRQASTRHDQCLNPYSRRSQLSKMSQTCLVSNRLRNPREAVNHFSHLFARMTMTSRTKQPRQVQQPCAGLIWEGLRDHACVASATIERDGKWWCRHHDPVKKAERRAAQDREWDEKRARGKAIVREGKRLATRLGVDAGAHYHSDASFQRSDYQKYLVISFEDVEKTITRLERLSHPRSKRTSSIRTRITARGSLA